MAEAAVSPDTSQAIADGNGAAQEISEVAQQLAGKYLTFKLAEEEYGIEILKVQEIIQMQDVTRVPRTPDFVRGVINLRGKVIPIIELRKKFSMEVTEDTDKTCIIIVKIGDDETGTILGIIIDEVSEVLDIAAKDIQEAPSFGNDVNTEFILGIGTIEGKVKMLLDIDKVLSSQEMNELAKMSKS
jgi:purine-binding chemotaxis protein CheW